MKKSFIAASSLALLMGAGVALAQWNHESFPPFEDVDLDNDGVVSMEEVKAHPGATAAITTGQEGSAEEAIKSFFSAKNQHDKDKPYDSPLTKEEWEGMTND